MTHYFKTYTQKEELIGVQHGVFTGWFLIPRLIKNWLLYWPYTFRGTILEFDDCTLINVENWPYLPTVKEIRIPDYVQRQKFKDAYRWAKDIRFPSE